MSARQVVYQRGFKNLARELKLGFASELWFLEPFFMPPIFLGLVLFSGQGGVLDELILAWAGGGF